jgi:hypothetical protein
VSLSTSWRPPRRHRPQLPRPILAAPLVQPARRLLRPAPAPQVLCDGLEEDLRLRRQAAGLDACDDLELLVRSSGKMLLLHKLLPKLRAEGRQVGGCAGAGSPGRSQRTPR